MDVLSDILQTLQLRGSLYFRTELGAPWGLDVPARPNVARFHVVIGGACLLHVTDPTHPPTRLAEGDLAIVPHGARHVLRDALGTTPVPVDEVLDETAFDGRGALAYGGPGRRTTLVCGHFEVDEGVLHPLLEALPELIHLPSEQTRNYAWLSTVLEFIGHEAGSVAPGADAIVARVSEILLIQVIRGYLEHGGRDRIVLSGLADPRIGAALTRIHREPAAPWRVEDLARHAGMSRTAFAVRFSELMGLSPMEYVTRWRLQRAHALLRRSDDSVAAIGEAVGYRSEASFSKLFKRYYGVGPGRARRGETG